MADWNALCFDAMPGLRSGLPLDYSRQSFESTAAGNVFRPANGTAELLPLVVTDAHVEIDAPKMQDVLGNWYKRLP